MRSSCMWVSRDWVSLPRSALVALIALLKCALKRSSSSAFDTSLDTSGCAAGCLRCIHENTMTNDTGFEVEPIFIIHPIPSVGGPRERVSRVVA